jgi:hypothetical protein
LYSDRNLLERFRERRRRRGLRERWRDPSQKVE